MDTLPVMQQYSTVLLFSPAMPPTLALAATLELFQSLLTLPLTQQLLMVPLFSPAMPPTRRESLLTLPLTLQLLMVPVPVFLPVMPPK